MSNMRPCPTPHICGVKSHRPGTACAGDRSKSPGQQSRGIPSTTPTSASARDEPSARDIILSQRGWVRTNDPEGSDPEIVIMAGDSVWYSDSSDPGSAGGVITPEVSYEGDGQPAVLYFADSDGDAHPLEDDDLPHYMRRSEGTQTFTVDDDDLEEAMYWMEQEGKWIIADRVAPMP